MIFSKKLAELTASVEGLEAEKTSLQASVTELTAKADGLRAQVSELEAKLQAKDDDHSKAIEALKAQHASELEAKVQAQVVGRIAAAGAPPIETPDDPSARTMPEKLTLAQYNALKPEEQRQFVRNKGEIV